MFSHLSSSVCALEREILIKKIRLYVEELLFVYLFLELLFLVEVSVF